MLDTTKTNAEIKKGIARVKSRLDKANISSEYKFYVVLMGLFLIMNGADYALQEMGAIHYVQAGSFPISQFLLGILPQDELILYYIERGAWWLHITGVLIFLNYLLEVL